MEKIGPTPEEHAELEEQAQDLRKDLNDNIAFWEGKSDFIAGLLRACLNQLLKVEGLRRRHWASEDSNEREPLRKEINFETGKLSELVDAKERAIEDFLGRN